MIGAKADAIDKAENRERFDKAMKKIGLECPRAGIAHSMEEAWDVQKQVGFLASSVHHSPWVVLVAVLLTTLKNSKRFVTRV